MALHNKDHINPFYRTGDTMAYAKVLIVQKFDSTDRIIELFKQQCSVLD